LVYTEAFNRINLKFEIKFYPIKRATLMLCAGDVDGDLGRITTFHDEYPQFVQVEESAATLKLVAFSTNPDIRIDEWESLRGTPFRVDYLRGTAAIESVLPSLVKIDNIYTLNNWKQGVKRLLSGRADIYIDFEGSVLPNLLNDAELKNVEIRIAGVLAELPVQAYLQPKHEVLAKQLAEVLKDMKNEGLIEHYRLKALSDIGTLK